MSAGSASTLVIRNWNAGFVSNLNGVVNNLAVRLGRRGVEAVVVEWHAAPEMGNFCYGRQEDGNLWPHFFEPLAFDRFPARKIEVRGYATRGMTGIEAYAMHKLDRRWRERYHAVYDKHIRVRPAIVRRVEELYQAQMAGCHCVAVHYRHPAHYELLHAAPPPETFATWAQRLLPGDRSCKVLLATDFEPAVEVFRQRFGDRLVMQPDVTRSPSLADRHLHHHNTPPRLALGEQVLVDCLLMLRCNALVHVNSNLVTAVDYMNPRLRMVYCETLAEAAIGYLWSIFLAKTGLRQPVKHTRHVLRVLSGRGQDRIRRFRRRRRGRAA